MDNAIKMEAQRLLIAAALVKGSYYPEISPQSDTVEETQLVKTGLWKQHETAQIPNLDKVY